MHRDLIKPQHQSGGELFLASGLFLIGIIVTIFGVLACWEIYTVFHSGKPIDFDFICGLLLTPFLFVIGVSCLSSSPYKLVAWFCGKSWRNEMISLWGEKLTRLESSPDSAEGQLRIQRTRYGGGIRSSPSFEYAVEIHNVGAKGQQVKATFECVVATRKSEPANQGALAQLGKWYDGSTKSELIWLFERYKTDQLEDAECHRFTAPIIAQLKADSFRNPQMLFIETDESRLWCLASEVTKKPN